MSYAPTAHSLGYLKPSDLERIKYELANDPSARDRFMSIVFDYLENYISNVRTEGSRNAAQVDEVYSTLSKLATTGLVGRDSEGGFTVEFNQDDLEPRRHERVRANLGQRALWREEKRIHVMAAGAR